MALPSRDLGFPPTVVSARTGFSAEEGLAVEQPVITTSTAIAAIISQEVQLASVGSATRAAYQGAPLKAIFY